MRPNRANVVAFACVLVPVLLVVGIGVGSAQTVPSVTVMSYNIHHGEGTNRILDLNRIAEVINAADPDIVSLQEVDKNTNRSGGVDQAAVLASLTGMSHQFGKAVNRDGGEYGNAILTKHPMTLIGNWPLPGFKEARAALFVKIDLASVYGDGVLMTFIATHLDHKKSANRIQSADDIEAVISGLPGRPALLGGDLNDRPGTATLNEFDLYWEIEDLGQAWWTFPAGTPNRQLDYVLYRNSGDWTVHGIEVPNEPVASDHRPIVYTYALNTLPTATFTESCVALTCDFSDRSYDSDGSIVEWSWNFGDGGTSVAQHPSHPYLADSTYTVSLMVTDDDGNTDATFHDVTVSSAPPPDMTLSTMGYKIKGRMKADLSWAGAALPNIDVYRDGALIATTANDGFHTDHIDQRGSGSFVYEVCDENTSRCSNESVVVF